MKKARRTIDTCIALLRQDVDMTPVWMMRQAGRYLPEYKATRAVAGDHGPVRNAGWPVGSLCSHCALRSPRCRHPSSPTS